MISVLLMASALNLLRVPIAAEKLPYDTELEYLKSDGNAYIDTGVLVSSDISVYNEMYSESKTDFNTDGYYDNTQEAVIRFYRYVPWSYRDEIQLYCGTSMSYSNPPYSVQTWHSILTDIKNKVAILDGTSYNYNYASTFTGKANLPIFARCDVKSTGTFYYVNAVNRERIFKIWQNDVLVRDFIPVRVGSVGYMYDRVSKQLFGNSGTGAFILGPDKN